MTDPLDPPLDGRPHDDRPHDQDATTWIAPPEDVPPISAEDLVDGQHGDESGADGVLEERRYPSTIGGAFYLAVLATTIAGLAVVAFVDWRIGIRVMGGALILGAVVRLVLQPRDAGMLAVRAKTLDATLLAGLGAALIFLATSIPDQPGF
ncbi:DUF3017 domain-containing protein [Nocardioides piscis]|uniref:DUF3017 domain-containing protein n=1 Tax=Nocardioides piscis TaxID=2714938 RepID=A0A6G7YFU1_9ACTN|nr:DUF3017 domain-containing protein [Nocardioides piscis]QIK75511.1 DUF3017 domain-containing protein [Nocardioides piscis]